MKPEKLRQIEADMIELAKKHNLLLILYNVGDKDETTGGVALEPTHSIGVDDPGLKAGMRFLIDKLNDTIEANFQAVFDTMLAVQRRN